ncbi:hypothetical protein [Roseateles amylovorans]|uniref:Uncharacterized protein n=1 Tax=Roseateles amylovorans TaxID=2978473 RepID=A0ABY6B3Y0_9BURK|nr:hypothetical protein [Roseateles amylovorans]UXH79436.1 hypothetical protein N4261_05775 [Roseateles amylovorans]
MVNSVAIPRSLARSRRTGLRRLIGAMVVVFGALVLLQRALMLWP